MVRAISISDAQQVCDIYNYYIQNSTATFETEVISVNEMRLRIERISSLYPWLVFEETGDIQGYAYASKWRRRAAYNHSVESTVYLKHGQSGKGIGTKLYSELIDELIKQGLHVIIGGISLPNEASIALHEKFGFEKAAHYKEVGNKFDQWVDVGYWELIITQT